MFDKPTLNLSDQPKHQDPMVVNDERPFLNGVYAIADNCSQQELRDLVKTMVDLSAKYDTVLIGGPPYVTGPLLEELLKTDKEVYYNKTYLEVYNDTDDQGNPVTRSQLMNGQPIRLTELKQILAFPTEEILDKAVARTKAASAELDEAAKICDPCAESEDERWFHGVAQRKYWDAVADQRDTLYWKALHEKSPIAQDKFHNLSKLQELPDGKQGADINPEAQKELHYAQYREPYLYLSTLKEKASSWINTATILRSLGSKSVAIDSEGHYAIIADIVLRRAHIAPVYIEKDRFVSPCLHKSEEKQKPKSLSM